METKLPTTEQELNDLIDAKVNEAIEKVNSKHNGEMAAMRKKHDDELKRAKEQASLSAEELAQEKIKEENEAKDRELNELRSYKKTSIITEKLAKESLPSFFKNDARLLNAEEGDLDKVVKDIKKEYEATLPRGATHSTVVQQATTGATQSKKDDNGQAAAFEAMGQALEQALGK